MPQTQSGSQSVSVRRGKMCGAKRRKCSEVNKFVKNNCQRRNYFNKKIATWHGHRFKIKAGERRGR